MSDLVKQKKITNWSKRYGTIVDRSVWVSVRYDGRGGKRPNKKGAVDSICGID